MTDILSVILCYDSWSLESDFHCYIPPQQSSSQCNLDVYITVLMANNFSNTVHTT